MSGATLSANGRRPAPRLPTWLLAVAVLAALAAAGWLFTGELRRDDTAPSRTPSATDSGSRSDGDVLELPDDAADDDDTRDPRRRGAAGRARTERGTAAADDAGSQKREDALPAIAANLRGLRIGLVPASAAASGDAQRTVRIDGRSVACSAPAQVDDLAIELTVLDRLERLVRRAGATPVRMDDDEHRVPCADRRVTQLAATDLFIVLDARGGNGARVIAAHNPSAAHTTSAGLAAELAAALDIRGGATAGATTQLRTLLARTGVVQLRAGAPGALVELGLSDQIAQERLDAMATALLGGLATAATARDDDQAGHGR